MTPLINANIVMTAIYHRFGNAAGRIAEFSFSAN